MQAPRSSLEGATSCNTLQLPSHFPPPSAPHAAKPRPSPEAVLPCQAADSWAARFRCTVVEKASIDEAYLLYEGQRHSASSATPSNGAHLAAQVRAKGAA